MHHLREFDRIRESNPLHGLITVEMIKGRIKNPIQDVVKGRVTKQDVLTLLEYAYDTGLVQKNYKDTFQSKLQEIA